MSTPDFSTTMFELRRLHGDGDYMEALELLQREAAGFPQQSLMYHWKMCLTARVGRSAEAIQALRDALVHGYWYPSRLLRDDEDLQSLQGIPEFEELVAAS